MISIIVLGHLVIVRERVEKMFLKNRECETESTHAECRVDNLAAKLIHGTDADRNYQ